MKEFYEKYADDRVETPFRMFLKEVFKYSDHVDIFTFRNYSLAKLVEDQMDKRKHVSFDTVAAADQIVDFLKISNFKGIINYDLDFQDEAFDAEDTAETIKMVNARFLANGYTKMGRMEYMRFMEYMRVNPSYNTNQYIVI